jgi:hypothetical protein
MCGIETSALKFFFNGNQKIRPLLTAAERDVYEPSTDGQSLNTYTGTIAATGNEGWRAISQSQNEIRSGAANPESLDRFANHSISVRLSKPQTPTMAARLAAPDL